MTLLAAVVACAVLAVAALVSIPLLHALQRASGETAPALQERAYLADPSLAAPGILAGQSFQVDVVPSNERTFRFTTSDEGRPGPSGNLRGAAGSTIVLNVSTLSAVPGTWFTVHVEGISLPLQVWIR